ncbi:MAG: DUF4340 domain-containing protein [Oscillospiraceae bacterium]|nr:DUF4340 domain-containing protein [Oscillospiraceae bacterium]
MSEQLDDRQKLQQQAEEEMEGMDFFADAPKPAAAAAEKKGLSKNTKLLIGTVCVLAVLGGTLTCVLLLGRNSGTGEDSGVDSEALSQMLDGDDAEQIMLNEEVAEDVTGIDIDGASQFSVTVARDTETMTCSIKGFEGIPLDQSLLSTLVNNGSELFAMEHIEDDPADPAKYGLDAPAADVTMHYKDGTDFSFRVGTAKPLDTTYSYVETGGTVYLVKASLVANYQKKDTDFVSTTLLEEPPQESYPIVESLTLERKDLDYTVLIEYDHENADNDSIGGTAATHVLREPIFSYLSPDKSVDVTNGMFGLSAQEITAIHPDAQTIAKAGLDDPFCTAVMECDDGNTYTLTIGDRDTLEDGTAVYYTMLEGTDVLYAVSAEDAVWATVLPGDITSANIFATYVWNIATLDVTADGESLHFEGEGSDQESYTVTKNGETCDTERFRTFFRFLLNIYGEELCIGEALPDRAPDASIHITTQDGREDYTVDIYRMEGLRSMIAYNGVPSYLIRTSCLDTLAENMRIFDDTEKEFALTWQ